MCVRVYVSVHVQLRAHACECVCVGACMCASVCIRAHVRACMRVRGCRKLKKDLLHELTDSSTSGVALSVVAALVMIGLVVAELSAYMTIATDSRIVLDHFESSSDDT